MKKLLLAVLLLASFGARAEEVYLLPGYDDVGNEMPKNELWYTLYLSRKCQLPIANQKNLLHADVYNPAFKNRKPDSGCWGMALEPTKSQVVIIEQYGHVRQLNLTAFARAKISGSGAYIIQGPAMTFEQVRENTKRYHDTLR